MYSGSEYVGLGRATGSYETPCGVSPFGPAQALFKQAFACLSLAYAKSTPRPSLPTIGIANR
ncbi:hypothetical protein I2494_04155 [Budviciaceae bacterium BWR-B9]|uniref:Uncharacterized protein n=1 Tax=Limnobaculum allomyrinae TaxID=2791986 RepID=A0ABS1IME5_9GAMM|nr:MULTISPECIES: hypothetical protein [Limnobaculum]MBK5142916.1 hypothetical protein [Limnobaculum allomyrinae]MBV7690197.1 hypothetical protein [Limnobaculum sp. M2-1]